MVDPGDRWHTRTILVPIAAVRSTLVRRTFFGVDVFLLELKNTNAGIFLPSLGVLGIIGTSTYYQ